MTADREHPERESVPIYEAGHPVTCCKCGSSICRCRAVTFGGPEIVGVLKIAGVLIYAAIAVGFVVFFAWLTGGTP